jgi:hypothetical protein
VFFSEVAMQYQIDDLKKELALALQSRDSLQAQLIAGIKRDSKCFLLETIPIEVRIEIYKNLLINPILGEPDCIHGGFSSRYGSTLPYGLTPGILGTCHQIYVEASPILYEQNTILIACVEARRRGRHFMWTTEWEEYINLSPLTRYCRGSKTRNDYTQLEQIPAFARVKNWKVLVSRLGSIRDHRLRLSWSLPTSAELSVIQPPKP